MRKPKQRGRNYTVGERSIITIAVLAGIEIADINKILAKEQEKTSLSTRELNESSFQMLRDRYLPKLTDTVEPGNPCDDREEDHQKRTELRETAIKLLHHVLSPRSLRELLE